MFHLIFNFNNQLHLKFVIKNRRSSINDKQVSDEYSKTQLDTTGSGLTQTSVQHKPHPDKTRIYACYLNTETSYCQCDFLLLFFALKVQRDILNRCVITESINECRAETSPHLSLLMLGNQVTVEVLQGHFSHGDPFLGVVTHRGAWALASHRHALPG